MLWPIVSAVGWLVTTTVVIVLASPDAERRLQRQGPYVRTDGERILHEVEGPTLVVSLDARQSWFRWNHLLAEMISMTFLIITGA